MNLSPSPKPIHQTVSLVQAGIDWLAQRLPNTDHPRADSDRLQAARLCRQIDRLRDADDHFKQLLARHADQAWLWLEAGQLSDKLGETQQAVARYTHAAQDPGPVGHDALKALALTCLSADDAAKAGRAFFKLTRRAPQRAEGWAGLIVCAALTRRPRLLLKTQLAFTERFDAPRRTADLCRIWLHAAAADATGECNNPQPAAQAPPAAVGSDETGYQAIVDWASSVLSRAADQQPGRADTHYHLAVCQDHLHRQQDGLKSAQAAVAINPRYQKAAALAEKLGAANDQATEQRLAA